MDASRFNWITLKSCLKRTIRSGIGRQSWTDQSWADDDVRSEPIHLWISGNKQTLILPEYDGASSQIVRRHRRLSARDQPLQRRGWRRRKGRIIAAGWMSVSAVFLHPSPGVCVWIQLQTLRRDPLREPHPWVWSVVRNFPRTWLQTRT